MFSPIPMVMPAPACVCTPSPAMGMVTPFEGDSLQMENGELKKKVRTLEEQVDVLTAQLHKARDEAPTVLKKKVSTLEEQVDVLTAQLFLAHGEADDGGDYDPSWLPTQITGDPTNS